MLASGEVLHLPVHVEEAGEELASLAYAKGGVGWGVKVVLAVPVDHPAERAGDLEQGARISTEYRPGCSARIKRTSWPQRVQLRVLGWLSSGVASVSDRSIPRCTT